MMYIRRGVLKGFSGSWGSGIATLLIEDSGTGITEAIPCENPSTVRALESCFGNVIGEGHCVKAEAGFVGEEVFWSMGEMGLVFGGFMPVSEANEELLEEYEKDLIKRGE